MFFHFYKSDYRDGKYFLENLFPSFGVERDVKKIFRTGRSQCRECRWNAGRKDSSGGIGMQKNCKKTRFFSNNPPIKLEIFDLRTILSVHVFCKKINT